MNEDRVRTASTIGFVVLVAVALGLAFTIRDSIGNNVYSIIVLTLGYAIFMGIQLIYGVLLSSRYSGVWMAKEENPKAFWIWIIVETFIYLAAGYVIWRK